MHTEGKAPAGLLAQWKLLGAIIDSPWATRLDHKVARQVIDNHYARFGSSRASLRFLATATGADKTNVIRSLRHLEQHGLFCEIRKGVGTRPTEYVLNFELSGGVGNTASNGGVATTPAGSTDAAASGPSGGVGNTKTCLRSPLTCGLTEGGNEHRGAATPPDGVAPLGASAAGSPRDPQSAFDRFWAAYPRRHGKAKAKAAYTRLLPDQALAERLEKAAAFLADHHAASGTEPRFIPEPANWLRDERWDEDLPIAYSDPRTPAASAGKLGKPGKAGAATDLGVAPGRYPCRISVADVSGNGMWDGDKLLALRLDVLSGAAAGTPVPLKFFLTGKDEQRVDMDCKRLEQLNSAVALSEVMDSNEYINRDVILVVDRSGGIEFERLTKADVPGRP